MDLYLLPLFQLSYMNFKSPIMLLYWNFPNSLAVKFLLIIMAPVYTCLLCFPQVSRDRVLKEWKFPENKEFSREHGSGYPSGITICDK